MTGCGVSWWVSPLDGIGDCLLPGNSASPLTESMSVVNLGGFHSQTIDHSNKSRVSPGL